MSVDTIVDLVAVLWAASVVIGVIIGRKKGRPLAGLLLPLFLPGIGLIILRVVPDRATERRMQQEYFQRTVGGQILNELRKMNEKR